VPTYAAGVGLSTGTALVGRPSACQTVRTMRTTLPTSSALVLVS